MMSSRVRKFALIVHVTASVGWIGAVVAYLALVVAAMTTQVDQVLSAAWLAMELIGLFALVPLSLMSVLTGLIMSLGTKWGLFRHYWVLFSLALTLFASVILIQHMPSVSVYAQRAAVMNTADVGMLRAGLQSELVHAGIGLVVLLIIQAMNVYKPRGVTPYGWRKQQAA